MARITIEDCLHKVNNRFSLIHVAAKRVRQLRKGSEPTIIPKNKDIVVALREIAAGNVEMSLRSLEPSDAEIDSGDVLIAETGEEAQEKTAEGEVKEV